MTVEPKSELQARSPTDEPFTESRDIAVKKLGLEARTVVEVLVRDLEQIGAELRSIKKPRRWLSVFASVLVGIAVAALFAGIAGIHRGDAPVALRVGYFCTTAFCGTFAAILFVVDRDEIANPMTTAKKVLGLMESNDLIALPAPETHKVTKRERLGAWWRRNIHDPTRKPNG